MKIYTRKGDKGTTSLIGGQKVPKYHARIEAYGSADELIAHMGMIGDLTENNDTKRFIKIVQDKLMICAAILAADCENCKVKIPEIKSSDIKMIEDSIDEMEKELPVLQSFVLPGGNVVSSQCHIARTVCRRAERQIIKLSTELFVPNTVLQYVNRLSDYLFVLSRKVLHNSNKKDTLWNPKL